MEKTLDQVDVGDMSSEFDLPDLNHLPSLESILKEDDILGSGNGDDISVAFSELNTDYTESASVYSYDSRVTSRIKNKSLTEKHGPILKRSILRGVSSQIVSVNNLRIQAGIPTCVTCSGQLIATGTSKGTTLVFDKNQTLKWCLRLSQEEEIASVSALAISSDSKSILIGYSRGQLSFWDTRSGNLLQVLRDIQTALCCVLHIKFTAIDNLAVVSDSGGSMYQVVIKRRTMNAYCIFSGSNGEVLTLAPLTNLGYTSNAQKSVLKMCVVAFATVTKLIVISLHPRVTIHFTYPLKSDENNCPLISWLTTCDFDPLIAFARGCLINIFQVSTAHGKLNISFVKNIQLGYSLLAMNWFNPSIILLIDVHEVVHVMDFDVMEALESVEMNDLQLVYGSAFFKGLATGGNVSEAMQFAAERACYYSICPLMRMNGSVDRLFILGMKSMIAYSIRSWGDRIDWFVKQYKYPEALSLASSFYSGEARAVVGLPSSPSERREVVARTLTDLIKEYIGVGTTKPTPLQGSVDILVEHYNHVIPICVDSCAAIGSEGEGLIIEISDKLCNDVVDQSILFECLKEKITNGQLCKLNPEITKDIIEYFEGKGRLLDVESMIVRLELSCLDIHQCMTMCRKYNLMDGIIHLHNRAFCDYTSPLLEIYQRIQDKILRRDTLEDEDNEFGMKLLVYISCCLTGRAYPYGDLDENERGRVRSEVINFLTERDSPRSKIQKPYSNLRTLLLFDTSEFLNVLSLAFEFDSLEVDERVMAEQNQKLVDTLLQVVVSDSEFSSFQIGSLHLFLARQVSKREHSILVSRKLLEDIIEYLTCKENDAKMEDRQQALLELVNSGKLDGQLTDKMLHRSLEVGFFRVCEIIYWQKRCFDKIILCLLQDGPRNRHIFSRIEQIMSSNSDATPEEKRTFLQVVLHKIKDLCWINCHQTAELLQRWVNREEDFKAILKSLESDQEVLFRLLNCLLPDGLSHTPQPNGVFNYLNESAVNEKFIELLCIYDPDSVVRFLSSCKSYRRTVALDLCQNYRMLEGSAYLLEQEERFLEAFELNFKCFRKIANPSYGPHFLNTEIEAVELELIKLLQFCERTSEKTFNEEDKQPLWFPLLECVQSLLQFASNDEQLEKLSHLTDMVFNEMIRFVSLISISQWMLQDHSKAKLPDVKELLMKAIDACNSEAALFRSTSRLLNADLYCKLKIFISKSQKSISSKLQSTCDKCLGLYSHQSNLVIFNCNHTFHVDCLEDRDFCALCSGPTNNGSGCKKATSLIGQILSSETETIPRIESAFTSGILPASHQSDPSWENPSRNSQALSLTPDWKSYRSVMK